MRSMTEIETLQWLFDTEVFTKALNWPVHIDGLVLAKRMVDEAVHAKATAEDVLAAYEKFGGAIGPTVMTMLLESDDAFPEANHSGKPTPPSPGKVTLYVDRSGKCVLAECFKEWGRRPVFSVA
jgi:hypothetical protein